MTDIQIDVENLRVAFDGTEVLRGVTLRVPRGEFVAVVGASGSGKSTLLNVLAGFVPATGVRRVPERFGFVFQSHAVFPWLTARGNVEFGLEELPRPERHTRAASYLELVGLTPHADRYPGHLSGGQVQRVALARALAPRPDVIYFDEPFGALDTFTRQQMQEHLVEVWRAEPRTAVFVTHNIDEAVILADTVVVMTDGRLGEPLANPRARRWTAKDHFREDYNSLKERITDAIAAGRGPNGGGGNHNP